MSHGKILRTLIITLPLLAACANDHLEKQVVPVCNANNPISFSTIQPIINAKCATSGCHDDTGIYCNPLTTMVQVQGNTISILYQLDHKVMPPSTHAQLTSTEFLEIECWINQGASNP